MKALVLEEYNKFIFKDVVKPKIGSNDVLVRVKACAICGSDVHGMDGSSGRRIPPIIMGHEAAGVIKEVGEQVNNYKKGDRVTFDSTHYCNRCYYCRLGKINLCTNRKVFGVSCSEYHKDGAFAEFIAVPKHLLYGLPENVSFEDASLIEPLSIALHALNGTSIKINDTAVVVGAGMIGLIVIKLLKITGCEKIIVVDIDKLKLDLALSMGATDVLNPDEVVTNKEILNLTNNRGADVSFEVVGIPQTIKTAMECLKKGGLLTLVGNLSPEVQIPLQFLVTNEITVKGSCASAGEYDTCIDMISREVIDLDDLISKSVPLSEGPIWFDKLYKKEQHLLKIILKP